MLVRTTFKKTDNRIFGPADLPLASWGGKGKAGSKTCLKKCLSLKQLELKMFGPMEKIESVFMDCREAQVCLVTSHGLPF